MSEISVYPVHRHQTVQFAAEELCKYLNAMAGSNAARVEETKPDSGQRQSASGIRIGLFTDFGIDTTSLADADKDDAVHVSIVNSQGLVSGSNPRSVLFAVYRLLQDCGCRWVRPGPDGEIVPPREVGNLQAEISEQAVYRFRGNTGCGSAGPEEKLHKIDWMAKVGLNTFFHEGLLDYLPAWHQQLIKAVKQRGMLYHSAGHGWPAAFFKVPAGHSDHDTDLAERAAREQQYVALVDGRRETGVHARKPRGGAKNTELCYGHPEVRSRLVRCVADYAQRYPEVDLLHFWMSDSMNVNCECELCRDTRPSDFYVMLLNGIDEELTARGLSTRIVFLIYQELVWAPEFETLKNPDRFVMMFAPISRRFNEFYSDHTDESLIGEFDYNRNTAVKKMAGFVAAVNHWRELFDGESFVFDYHMTWYHYYDLGYYRFAYGMAEDIKRLPVLRQNGFVSCQIVCAAFPSGFPLQVHAACLWNPDQDLSRLADSYFQAAFGRDGELARQYLDKLSDLSCRDYLRQFYPPTNRREEEQEALARLARIPETVAEFRPIIGRNLNSEDKVRRRSWEYLDLHADLVLLLSAALRQKFSGREEAAERDWRKTVDFIETNKERVKTVFDPFWFGKSYNRIFEA